jgi:hypothetical protein
METKTAAASENAFSTQATEQTAHSRGPWSLMVADDRYIHAANSELLICDTPYYPVAPSNEADYPLIAAAPELLADAKANLFAMENVLAYFHKHQDRLPPVSLASLEIRIEATRKVIAKATGAQ